jgi:putative transposase
VTAERSFAWSSRNRRLWTDPEATLASASTFLHAAAVMILV